MAVESELIFLCRRGGVPWSEALELEFWELAAALGLHRVETIADRDTRILIETQAEYWDQTGAQRMAKIAERAERRKGAGKR
jgi:hypothetical protein